MVPGNEPPLRLWPRASLPLDATRSYIALFPHPAADPARTASDRAHFARGAATQVDADPRSPRARTHTHGRAAHAGTAGSTEIDAAISDRGHHHHHHHHHGGGDILGLHQRRNHQQSGERMPHRRERRETAVAHSWECVCDLAAGSLELVHGAATSEATRVAARIRFDELATAPSERIPDLLPAWDTASEATLRAHLDIVAATPPPTSSQRSLASATLSATTPSLNLAETGPIAADAPRRVESARQDRSSSTPVVPARPSRSLSSLPLLNFEHLPDLAAMSSSQICTARRQVDSIVSTLSRVRPFMYVSGVEGVRDIHRLHAAKVTHILNLAGYTVANLHEGSFVYKRMCPRDDMDEDLSVLFDDVFEFIDGARRQGGAVVVHCHMGISRGCAAVAAFLMMDEGLTHEKALRQLRAARPVSEPNSAFVDLLVDLEHRIRRGIDDPVLYRVQPHRKDRDPDYMVPVPMNCSSFGLCNSSDFAKQTPGSVGLPRPGSDLSVGDTCGTGQDSTLVGRKFQLDGRFGWILAMPGRAGFYGLGGPELSEHGWRRTQEIARQMGRHEERYEAMFSLQSKRSSEQVQTEQRQKKFCCPVLCWDRQQFDVGSQFAFKVLKHATERRLSTSDSAMTPVVCGDCCLTRWGLGGKAETAAAAGSTTVSHYGVVPMDCCEPSGSSIGSFGEVP